MPPAITSSDEETSDVEMTTTSTRKTGGRPKSAAAHREEEEDDATPQHVNGDAADDDDGDDGEDGEEDEEGEGDEELYIVEKILSHEVKDGVLFFRVKWEGYDKVADQTWEPEENIVGSADDVLNEYYAKVGDRETLLEEVATANKTKKRGRASAGPQNASKRAKKTGDHPLDSEPPATMAWKPPAGSWEDLIAQLDACEDEETGKLMVYLTWTNGQKTQHEPSVIYKRCPQKMLQFYERHVRIVKRDPEEQGES